MKEEMLDMILYLYESLRDDEIPIQEKQEFVTTELLQAGFSKNQIQWAVNWLQFIIKREYLFNSAQLAATSKRRMFNEFEKLVISGECRKYLYLMEDLGLLDATTREVVIDGLIALSIDNLTIDDVRQVIRLVIANQDKYQPTLAWLELDATKGHQQVMH